ncbi:MAG: 30S ribosome-binding factor RbfA [Dysgonamonadaceae bacterium]|jgi:ribosome-binding factor A|nr:30S ribosome-binding factor RbfA [Dysgonamonadaceae bacterium]
MNNTRLQKIERMLQKDLGEIFRLQTQRMNGVLVSVTKVRISPDLSLAKGYLSVFPSEKSIEIITNINKNKKAVRYELGIRIGKQVRKVPELVFYNDDSIDYIENIDRLLKQDAEKTSRL